MDVAGLYHPYIAVDARAGVPAAVGIAAVVHPHGQHVLSLLQVRSHVVHEGDVAIGTLAQQLSVQIDFATVIYSLEVNVVALVRIGHIKCLAVPSDTAGQIACATGQCGRHLSLDAPVVRQVQLAPFAVVVGGLGGFCGIF